MGAAMFLIKKPFFLLLVLMLTACGGSSARKKKPETGGPERRGVTVSIVDLKYYDSLPSLTSDGDKVAFISGRSGKRQAYLKTLSSDSDASRILPETQDLGEELEVAVAPNGTFVVILSFDGSNYSIHLKKLDSGEAVELSKDAQRKSDIGISPDSLYVSFAKIGENADKEIYVGKIAAGLTSATLQRLGSDNKSYLPKWNSSTPNQQLLAFRRGELIGQTEILRYSFTTDQDTAALEPEVLGSSVLGEKNLLTGGNTYGYFVKDANNQNEVKTRSSLGDAETLETVNVLSEPERILLSDASSETVEPSGFRIRDISVNAGGDFAAWVTQVRIRCKDKNPRYGSVLYTYQAGNGTQTMNLPVLESEAAGWTLEEESVCIQSLEGKSAFKIDDRINRVVLNSAATPASYTIVYESQFSQDDSALGDREIRALSVQGSEIKFYDISNNPKSEQ